MTLNLKIPSVLVNKSSSLTIDEILKISPNEENYKFAAFSQQELEQKIFDFQNPIDFFVSTSPALSSSDSEARLLAAGRQDSG